MEISFSQSNSNCFKISQNSLTELNSRIIRIARKAPNKYKIDSANIYHIFLVDYNGQFCKSEFKSGRFINSISLAYTSKRTILKNKKYLRTQALILDNNYQLRGLSNYFQYTQYYGNAPIYEYIAKLQANNEIDCCFSISNTPIGTYFYKKGSVINIIREENGKIVNYSLDRFFENHWDSFSSTSILFNKDF